MSHQEAMSGREGLSLTWGTRLAAAVLPLMAILLWEWSAQDLPVMRLFGDASGFHWRDAWLTRNLLHGGGRWLAGVVLLSLVWAAWRPAPTGPGRSERLWALGAVLLCLLVVPTLKRWSNTSCPWDLQEFGGQAQYVSHWLRGVLDGGPGHCFPSGHAIAAFAFFPHAVMWARHDRRRAALWLAGILLCGLAFALAQTVRGAHYPSHSMWSAWVCWVIALVTTGGPGRRRS